MLLLTYYAQNYVGIVGASLLSFGRISEEKPRYLDESYKAAPCICASTQWPSFLWLKGRSLGNRKPLGTRFFLDQVLGYFK